jgi:hypothetical protein
MVYLRFDPHDYQTLSRLCRSHDLAEKPLPAFKRLLLSGLAGHFPQLAGDVAAMGRERFQLLYNHFCARPHPERPHGLTGAEVELALAAGVPLMGQARFASPLKRALVGRLAEWHADLAAKVERLSLAQFQALCEEACRPGRSDA